MIREISLVALPPMMRRRSRKSGTAGHGTPRSHQTSTTPMTACAVVIVPAKARE